MSPDLPPEQPFGRNWRHVMRAAVLLTLLGVGAVYYVARLLTLPRTPLGMLLKSAGVPAETVFWAGCAAVLLCAVFGCLRSVRTAERYRVAPEGLEVRGSIGTYLLTWRNISEVGVTAGALGIRVRDRREVVNSHAGTPRQRHWLETMEPFGEWDYLFPEADLGRPAAVVAGWIEQYGPRWVHSDSTAGG